MKALASIVSIAIIIVAYAAPSHAQKGAGGAQTSVNGKQCYKLAVSRGERPGSQNYIRFMQQCKAGKVPL
jgi:hypothetical protein